MPEANECDVYVRYWRHHDYGDNLLGLFDFKKIKKIFKGLLGVLRLGFITIYLTDALVGGFTTGAAVHVFTSQLQAVLQVKADRYSGAFKLIYTYRDFFERISTINWATVITSLVCIIVLHIVSNYVNPSEKFKKISKVPVPIELIVVIFGTVASYFIQLEKGYGVYVVGDIPRGLPAPSVTQLVHIPDVIEDAVIIAIVVYAVSISMAKILAEKNDYAINPNQELIANAFCNIISSFFSCFVCAASLSRSLVQERVGGKTQVSHVCIK
ncbi:hypothetical protein CHS0354_011145 [Potamilus streckersoni]|uniref:SLC26A/SulP transporter domain-containing protein n=1 Tax=Potamilus streckersoni TaxID=2493646 RepID=A0AAE0VMD7_9BIVA|nr:hypothetical protein CHS0354_011145 [Potamilus streckersoni]